MTAQTDAAAARPSKKVRYRKYNAITGGDILIWAVMILSIAVVLFPILNIVAGSLSNSALVLRGQVGILPKGFSFNNYVALFSN